MSSDWYDQFNSDSPEQSLAQSQALLARWEQDLAKATRQHEWMTRQTFDTWIVRAKSAADLTRETFTRSFETIGDGIAGTLVDGTYRWRDAWKAVLKQVIATAAQVALMQGTMALLTGGTSLLGGGGGFFGNLGKAFHSGGYVPRHHAGVFSSREHPAILERGEYVLRKEAVASIGRGRLDAMNRTGSMGGGVHIGQIVIQGGSGRQMVDEFIRELKRRSLRGETIIYPRGVG